MKEILVIVYRKIDDISLKLDLFLPSTDAISSVLVNRYVEKKWYQAKKRTPF
jgi:hypothetical protein